MRLIDGKIFINVNVLTEMKKNYEAYNEINNEK